MIPNAPNEDKNLCSSNIYALEYFMVMYTFND